MISPGALAIHPPPLWKRGLLPVWNGGHRLARRFGEYLDAARHRRFERCVVCGRFAAILSRRGVIPPELVRRWGLSERLASAFARKESLDCSRCGAKLRARRLASALLGAVPTGSEPARSVADWVRRPEVRALRIAEINRVDGLHEQLQNLPSLAYSEYRDDVPPGTVVQGVRAEDLRQLTYPSAAFDLVLTSETLEHVPDLAAALAEIARILVPGGQHLFTIPWLPGVPTTYARASIGPDGQVVSHALPIYHPAGDTGYRVFTEFGADLLEIFRQAGFATEVRFGPATEDDLAQVFVCRKLGS